MSSLYDVCEDSSIKHRTEDLSLTGLQPCFEDTILLLPIFISFFIASVWRCRQCLLTGKLERKFPDEYYSIIIKLIICIMNFISNIIILDYSSVKFLKLVIPFALLGWLSIFIMILVETKYFSYKGQFISKGLYLWIFICTIVRWPTQKALGGTFWSMYLIQFLTQLILVLMNYFERYITLEEFEDRIEPFDTAPSNLLSLRRGLATATSDLISSWFYSKKKYECLTFSSNHGDESGRGIDNNNNTGIELNVNNKNDTSNTNIVDRTSHNYIGSPQYFVDSLNRTVHEETAEMQPVPWTDEKNPEGSANIISRMFFSYISPFIAYGHDNDLTVDDCFDLRAIFHCVGNFYLFQSNWNKNKSLVEEMRMSSIDNGTGNNTIKASTSQSSLVSASTIKTTNTSNTKQNNLPNEAEDKILFQTIIDTYKYAYAWGAPFLAIQIVAQLALPYLLRPLIEYLDTDNNNEPNINGYLYSIGFLVALLIMTLGENQYFHTVMMAGIRLRGALSTAIFRHSLRMTSQARQQKSIGNIVNLMASDVEKVVLSGNSIHNLWACPVRLILGMYILIDGIGLAGFFGLIAVSIFIPVQFYVMKQLSLSSREVSQAADVRIRLANELFSAMRIIKYYAWEVPFRGKIIDLREAELKKLWITAQWKALNNFLINMNPIAMSIGTFVAFSLLEGDLTPAQAFQATTLFGQLIWPLLLFPRAVSDLMIAIVSIERIEDLLTSNTVKECDTIEYVQKNNLLDDTGMPIVNLEGKVSDYPAAFIRIGDVNYYKYKMNSKYNKTNNNDNNNSTVDIRIENGTYSWGDNIPPSIIDVNINIKPESLVAIVGSTGQGKSSLLSAIIGDMTIVNGSAKLQGSLSYVPQHAWIFNATVKDNILFGLPFNQELYDHAIDISQLRPDIEKQFASGEYTEIGEKGINLSGGQRQRLSIARAIYANTDILVLDDPLSALDSHVGLEIFNNIKSLQTKTRLMALNQLVFAEHFDHIIVVNDGKILEQGSVDELMKNKNGEFYRLYSEFANKVKSDDNDENNKNENNSIIDDKIDNKKHEKDQEENEKDITHAEIKKQLSVKHRKLTLSKSTKEDSKETDKKDSGKLIQTEGMATGFVKYEVYSEYLKFMGMHAAIGVIGGLILTVAAGLATTEWLAVWSTETSKREIIIDPNTGQTTITNNAKPSGYYVGIFAALSVSQLIFNYIAAFSGYAGSVNSSRSLHHGLIESLLKAPISFYDSTPLGRITNRMSKDIGMIDNMLMFALLMVLRSTFQLLGMFIIIGINTTYVIVPFIPILMMFYTLQNYFRSTAVQLKRIEAVCRSPIYAQFSECLSGMSTIRAYLAHSRMEIDNASRIDINSKIFYLIYNANRWLSIRLEILGGLLIFATALNCVILRGSISPAAAGVSLSYALQVTTQLNILVRLVTEVEGAFNAVERIQEYMKVKSEADSNTDIDIIKNINNFNTWPNTGKIELKSLNVSYRPDMPPVLKNFNLIINGGEKIGVCGRTGAGKSSLFQSLFRMMEPNSGEILFDNINILKLGLYDVRNAISIIPQEPVLFSGTLRFNLDPFSLYSDLEIWSSLEKASLKEYLISHGLNLLMLVTEGGENFSVGQRQLICLARALLRKSKILVLDEATANVDYETDALIQKTIKEYFKDRTTLTIAHRLNTIIDCDRILVMEFGNVKEFDTPKNLLLNNNSEFSSMVKDTGPESSKKLKEIVFADNANDIIYQELQMNADKAKLRLSFNSSSSSSLSTTNNNIFNFSNRGDNMNNIYNAAEKMKYAWINRRNNEWVSEYDQSKVHINQWLQEMSYLLSDINRCARNALDEESLFYDIYGGISDFSNNINNSNSNSGNSNSGVGDFSNISLSINQN